MDDLEVRQLETLFWAVSRDQRLLEEVLSDDTYAKMFYKSLMNAAYKRSVSIKARGLKYVVSGLHTLLPNGEFPKN